ncbi:MAG: hypothetical protein SFY80_16130 [Verrucomicrobiota bacterium]|nr:hypothetical protein [Verrucomicrobiota bacterium]
MENFIKQKIEAVFTDFQKQAKNDGQLCACKGLTYVGGLSPDYNSPLIQQNYMLRFFPAYLAEYYIMYKEMLKLRFLPDRLKVLSIGCGCGVDLWGLYFAIIDLGGVPGDRIEYTGVDLADWQYRDKLDMTHVRFLTQDITVWNRLDADDYNVFVFPKCIGEFPAPVYKSICNIFDNTHFQQTHICGLCSLMDKGIDADADRFNGIAQIMQDKHGFHCLDELNIHWHVEDQNIGLRTICPSFVYPNTHIERVKTLLNQCPNYVQHGEACKDDCIILNRSPILTSKYINYKLLRFER